MCFYGNCRSYTCENCKPKLVTCPHCGEKTLMRFDICIYCKKAVSKELKKAAVDAWLKRQEEARQEEFRKQEAKTEDTEK